MDQQIVQTKIRLQEESNIELRQADTDSRESIKLSFEIIFLEMWNSQAQGQNLIRFTDIIDLVDILRSEHVGPKATTWIELDQSLLGQSIKGLADRCAADLKLSRQGNVRKALGCLSCRHYHLSPHPSISLI